MSLLSKLTVLPPNPVRKKPLSSRSCSLAVRPSAASTAKQSSSGRSMSGHAPKLGDQFGGCAGSGGSGSGSGSFGSYGSSGSSSGGGGSQSHRKLGQSASCGSHRPAGGRLLAQEVEQLLLRLEQGSLLVKFHSKGKPEKRTFALRGDSGQLVCLKPSAGVETSVSLFEVREVRTGRCSKVFEKWADDARKYDNAQCFVVLYGSAFRLKSLSCVGESGGIPPV